MTRRYSNIYKYIILYSSFCFSTTHIYGQDTMDINEVKIFTYLVRQNLMQSPAAASIIDSTQLKYQAFNSLVPAFNSVPGVRVEERSPGSYRLSIRGSLLRSPFGIRNIKVYMDDYPLTDAGGNTYLNAISMNGINAIEILKGPDGSLFGANSGGVVNIKTGKKGNIISGEVAGGSYGLLKQNIIVAHSQGNNDFSFTQSYYRNDGYRQNSKMQRLYLQANNKWQYSKKSSLSILAFYSDLFYATPGGLTYSQYINNPSQARQPTPVLPGAAEQKAAVYNKMIFGGITYSIQLSAVIKNVLAVFGSSVDFKNPFITNYEVRKENTFGARTYFIFGNNNNKVKLKFEYNIGTEWQQTRSGIDNYANILGEKGLLLASGNVNTSQYFFFNRIKTTINEKLILEAGLSLNFYTYHFTDSFVLQNSFKPQWMPRFGINYAFSNQFTIRSSVSKGYSPPTTAEIRPSDNRVYSNLQAETGLNIEFGARYFSGNKRLWVDLSLFQYRLSDAIVRQQAIVGTEFFVNAGGTDQKGTELQAYYIFILPHQNRQIKKLQFNNSITCYNFNFSNYRIDTANYSGKLLTGVPKFVSVSSLIAELKNGFYLFVQHNHTSPVFLNDANTVKADAFELIQLKAGFNFFIKHKYKVDISAGVDNLLNVTYSLGNDLNASGGRFYNAAPLRNYFIGIAVSK